MRAAVLTSGVVNCCVWPTPIAGLAGVTVMPCAAASSAVPTPHSTKTPIEIARPIPRFMSASFRFQQIAEAAVCNRRGHRQVRSGGVNSFAGGPRRIAGRLRIDEQPMHELQRQQFVNLERVVAAALQ